MCSSELMIIELDALSPFKSIPYTDGTTEIIQRRAIAIRKLNKHSDLVSALCVTTLPSSARKSSRTHDSKRPRKLHNYVPNVMINQLRSRRLEVKSRGHAVCPTILISSFLSTPPTGLSTR